MHSLVRLPGWTRKGMELIAKCPALFAVTISSAGMSEQLNVATSNEQSVLFATCAGDASAAGVRRLSPSARIEARAVDLAGNESAPSSPLQLAAPCESATDDEDDDGCSVSAGANRSGGALLALIALGATASLSMRRRRRNDI